MELKNTNAYDVTDLTSLEKLEPVRIRPGMYIGSTGSKGLHHCIWEIIDNSIDEIANGYGNKVTITLNEDKSVTVLDNGRGIPTGIHPIKKKSGVEMVFTELHTGGKFDNKIRLELIDKRKGQEITKEYYSENGLLDFINYLNESKTPIHEEPIIFDGERTVGELQLYGEVCIQFTDSTTEYIASYVNNIPTTEAGTHETGFKTGMTRSFKEWSKKLGLVKEKDKEFEGDDLREGMTAIVRIKITNPIFEGQTKTKLGNNEAYTMMNDLVYTKFSEWIEDNKTLATSIINNALEAAKRRDKIKKINEAEKKKIGKGTAPLAGKVAVCTLKDKTVNEFIVVEGDSAGGSAKQARDRRFQTIMPSKGKIMNTEKQKLENVLASEELKIFNTAVGTGTLDNYREEDLKYDKIIIMSDADVDGYHIRTLWMTYIYRYMRPLIANGHLYLAQPPLYKVYRETKGKTIVKYAYSDDELENTKKQVGKGALIQRYKGLGEMNPDQLWDTTLNPESRTLLQVTIEDAAKAEKMVSLLMGDIVEPRKNYMYKYGEF